MKNKRSTNKHWSWIKENYFFISAAILLAFIPLYPKLPLFDAIPGYIVRVRIEDFLIFLVFSTWFMQLIRGKVSLQPWFTKLILVYMVVGLLSSLSALFITQTVPLSPIHVAKLFFHYFRRLEYFTLFFIFFSSIKTKNQAKTLILIGIFTTIAVALYGYGQKYLYWPVYSTMNREFAKGWRLYLTEHARVPSTFGGHYDAAAFTMMLITISLSLVLFAKEKWIRITAFIAYLTGYYLLILTASRTSFLAYLFAANIVIAIAFFIWKKWQLIPKWLTIMAFSLVIAFFFGDLFDRFQQVPIIASAVKWRDEYEFRLPKLRKEVDLPENYVSVDELAMVTSKSDTPPVPYPPKDADSAPNQEDASPITNLPQDVYEEIPVPIPVLDENGNETGEVRLQTRQYSDAAHTYGLSAAIRYDTLWPRALAGLKRNPLLGSGYSTLTKESVGQFTEAESTDNEFLRVLGETGVLGFISFFSPLVFAVILSFKALKKEQDSLLRAYLIGFIAASLGLLMNAAYIDVFTASKVAETYWALTGIALAISIISLGIKNQTIKEFISSIARHK